jgi:serine/threonine-protein phosphatase 2A regulatory subunit B''
MLETRIKLTHTSAYQNNKLTKQGFLTFWKDNDWLKMEPVRRLFFLIAQPKSNYIVPNDFKPLFKYLLEKHPGLEFLQATPEF